MNEKMTMLPSMQLADNATEEQKWIQWTHTFLFVDGGLSVLYSQVQNEPFRKALAAGHRALAAVDKEFIRVIDEIKAGHPIPDVEINPSPIHDWDPSLWSGIIEMLRGALSTLIGILSRHIGPRLQPLIHSVAALVNNLEEILKFA